MMLNNKRKYKILLTGGTGFIGKAIINSICQSSKIDAKEIDIDIITRSNNKNYSNKNEKQVVNINFFQSDIRIINALPSQHYDYVIHAASPSSEERFKKKNSNLDRYNTIYKGTENLLKISNNCKFSKFLFFSSAAIYDNQEDKIITEDTNKYMNSDANLSFYSEAKKASETITLLYSEKNNFKANIIRLFAIVGPNMYLADDSKYIFANFIKSTYEHKNFYINTNPNSKRSFLDIDDCIRFIHSIMDTNVKNEIFNVGSDEAITLFNLAEKFNECLDKENKIICNSINDKITYLVPNIKKAKNLLGWSPQVCLNDSIIKIFKSYKENSK